jgi:hypothetical protein
MAASSPLHPIYLRCCSGISAPDTDSPTQWLAKGLSHNSLRAAAPSPSPTCECHCVCSPPPVTTSSPSAHLASSSSAPRRPPSMTPASTRGHRPPRSTAVWWVGWSLKLVVVLAQASHNPHAQVCPLSAHLKSKIVHCRDKLKTGSVSQT